MHVFSFVCFFLYKKITAVVYIKNNMVFVQIPEGLVVTGRVTQRLI